MPHQMDELACVAISPYSGILVGGHLHDLAIVSDRAYLFTWESRTITQLSTTMDESTKGKKCQKIKLSSGNTVVLFTLGIKVGNFQETGETYEYDISAGTFERKSLWDFPNTLITGTTQSHAIDNRMVLRTARGTFLFKDNETSTDTSSHWFKIDDWGFGQSAPFNLRYVIP